MRKTTARTIADGLTWARIISVVPITVLAWYQFRWWVFGLYIAGALTDLLDGWFARRAAAPKSDVDFDGLADIVFRAMTLLWIWLLVLAVGGTWYIFVLIMDSIRDSHDAKIQERRNRFASYKKKPKKAVNRKVRGYQVSY